MQLATRCPARPTRVSQGTPLRQHSVRRPALAARRPIAVRAASTTTTTEEKLAELAAVKQANARLRTELTNSLLRLQQLGGSDPKAAELISNAFRSLESLREDIAWPTPEDDTPFWKKSPLKQGLSAIVPPLQPTPKDERSLHVVHISAELAPIAKVGGLGDAVAGLASACVARGHHVECLLPFYECIDEAEVQGLEKEPRKLQSFFKGGNVGADVYKGNVGGLPVVLIRPDSNLFKGGAIYGGGYNEMEAYLYFTRACMEYLHQTGRQPHIIHYHDWHTAVAPVLYWDIYHPLGLNQAKVVLTIHNMDNTGECKTEELDWTGLEGEMYKVDERMMDPRTKGHNPERLSLLKGGIVYSSAVTTVSPGYAAELMSGGSAGWMKDTLVANKSKVKGLLNGIDTTVWDPTRDTVLPAQYSPLHAAPKALCKEFVMKGLGMPTDKDVPLVVCVSRLVPQKGIHLIKQALRKTAELGGAFVLLGSAPVAGTTAEFENLREELEAEYPLIKLLLMYSDPLSHHLYAAADFVLVPSMFEPCGLTQLVGMRYGALPIVRRTGGLGDTVHDLDDPRGQTANGFAFDGAGEGDVDAVLERAVSFYNDKRQQFDAVSKANMLIDHTWANAASGYIDLYNTL